MKKKPSSTGMRRDDCQYLHLQCQLETQTGGFQPEVPLLCRLERSTPEGSVTYVMDKSRLRSGWCRRTAKNGWQLQGSAQKSMAFRSYRQKKNRLK